MLSTSLLLALALAGTPVPVLGPDAVPLDAEGAAATVATRERWLFRPNPEQDPNTLNGLAGVETVAVLPSFSDLWILEADADDVAEVEAQWGPLGTLRRDLDGTPALDATTRLVGARPIVWDALGLRGNYVGTVAILDSGCDTAHNDLGDPSLDNVDQPPAAAGDDEDWWDADPGGFPGLPDYRVVGWHDVSDDMPGAQGPYDYHFHGTALAGVAFGGGDVDSDYQGVAPDGRFVVVKTYNFEGRWRTWASDFLLGVDWVLNHADVYNIQAILVGAVWDDDLEFTAAVAALADAGIAVIAPAGNDPTKTVGYPARIDEVIAVGATDDQGRIAEYSSPSELYPLRLDLVAPGGSRLTPDGGVEACDNEPNDTYRGRTGTSLAAAHVAGAVSIVQQILLESGHGWRRDASQVRWLESLLQVTAVETESAEPGAPLPHQRSRLGGDALEGFGLLQVPAAVDVVRNVLWPGDSQSFLLDEPQLGRAAWAARVPVEGNRRLRLELFPPAEADFDLFVYRESDDGFDLLSLAIRRELGAPEVVELTPSGPGWIVAVAKRVQGTGTAQFVTWEDLGPGHRWPVLLLSSITVPAVVHDLNGDDAPEVIVTNNVAIDPTGHTFYVLQADGRALPPFPRTYFSANGGTLTAPAVVDLGAGPVMVSGSTFGEIFGVNEVGVRVLNTALVDNVPTTAVSVWQGGLGTRLVVGTPDGVSLMDESGVEVDQWSMPGGVQSDLVVVPLAGDVDPDVVALETGVAVHARQIDGTPLPGWPVALPASGSTSTPIGVGDFQGNHHVAWLEHPLGSSSLVHLRLPDGTSAPGFPVVFSADPGGRTEARVDPIASRRQRGGEVVLLASAWHTATDGSMRLRMHSFDLNGQEEVVELSSVFSPQLEDGTANLTRRSLAPLRVLQGSSPAGAELWVSAQLAWNESSLGTVRRFGSFHPEWVVDVTGTAVRAWQSRSGRLQFPTGGALPVTVADLDGDHVPEVVVARGSSVYVATTPLASDPREFWSQPRADAHRTGCYGCAPDPVVSTPTVAPADRSVKLIASPNPFNPRTTLRLQAPAAGVAEWAVYDARGRRVSAWSEWVEPEHHRAWDAVDPSGTPLASGVYFVVVSVGGSTATQRVSLIR